jgi:hypothetical protein
MTDVAIAKTSELGPDDYFTITEGGPQHSEAILVTPDLARAWLDKRNKINRPLRDTHVDQFIWILKNGRWLFSQFGPGFDRAGNLNDGQHRLTAIVRSGIAARMWVTFNTEATYKDAIDTCVLPRRAHDVLPLSPREVAICNALIELERGSASHGSTEKVAAAHAQHGVGIEWTIRAFPFQRGITASLMAAHAYAYPVAQREVAAFTKQFLSHTAASEDAPAVVLHRYLDRSSRARLKNRDVGFAALRCLEAHCKGKALPRLSVSDAGFTYFAERRAAKGM